MTTREQTRQYRENNTRYLATFAANGNEPTDEQMKTARALISRLCRFGLANGNFDESETADNANSRYRIRKSEQLYNRGLKLSNDIEQFTGGRANISGWSMFCVNIHDKDGRTIARPQYFDY